MSTSRADVGTPSIGLGGWTTTEFCFHGFANLPTTRNEFVTSPEFSCFGHQWRLVIYPGGKGRSSEGYVAVNLSNRSDKSIKVQYGYSVRDADGKEVVHRKPKTNQFGEFGTAELAVSNAWMTGNFAPRSELLDALVDGALVIEVRMKSTTTTDKSITQFIPTNPFNKNVSKLFNEEETADVVFEVGGEQATGTITRKKSKTTTNFHAHRLILKNNSSTLYEMCGKADEGGEITTISITDVKPHPNPIPMTLDLSLELALFSWSL